MLTVKTVKSVFSWFKVHIMRVETCQDGIELHPRPHCCRHIKPNSKSIVILIESFNIMENDQLGLVPGNERKLDQRFRLWMWAEKGSHFILCQTYVCQNKNSFSNCFIFLLDSVSQIAREDHSKKLKIFDSNNNYH